MLCHSDAWLACGRCQCLNSMLLKHRRAVAHADDKGIFSRALELYSHVMPAPLLAEWWASTGGRKHRTQLGPNGCGNSSQECVQPCGLDLSQGVVNELLPNIKGLSLLVGGCTNILGVPAQLRPITNIPTNQC